MNKYIASIIIVMTLASPAMSAQYYVRTDGNNANTGLADNAGGAWATMKKAVDTMVAGDTATVNDGTYVEGTMRFNNNGTALNPITLKAKNKHLAILSSTSGCAGNIEPNASYIVIDGIRTQMDATNVPCGTQNSLAGTGIRCFEGNVPTTVSPSTTNHHVWIKNTRHDASVNRGYSIKCGGDGTIVEGNIAYNGMETGAGLNMIYRDNQILGTAYAGAGFASKFGGRNTQFYNNYVLCALNFGDCVYMGGSSSDGNFFDDVADVECYNCLAYNNVIVAAPGLANEAAVGLRGCKDCLFAFNTIVGAPIALTNTTGGGTGAIKPINPTYYNNTLTSTGVCKHASFLTNYTGTLTVDYNNFYLCTSPPTQAHGVTGDPRLRTNYTLKLSSPLRDRGVAITTWPAYGGGTTTLDLSTEPTWQDAGFTGRPSGTGFDIGAYESTNACP